MDKFDRETILVVDDRPDNLKLLFNLLTGEGFNVIIARDGENAIERVKHSLPHLILLDAMLPGIDGFETCKRLKQNPVYAEVPIIFMTGLTSLKDKIRGFEVGGVDYITKPFQLQEMLMRIKTHIKIQRLQHQLSKQNQQMQTEIKYRQTIEIALLNAQNNLEQQVEKRTVQLKATNALLEQKIIDLQAIEIDLQQALHAVESASRTKSDFLSKMSHELRTPLNAILGFTQLLLRDDSLGLSQQKKVEIIHENSENLLGLINNILSISQLDDSQEIMQKNCFYLDDFLTTIINFFRPKAMQKRLELHLELEENLHQLIQTDERKLRQVLINLLDNAIAFTHEGHVRLKVNTVFPSNLENINNINNQNKHLLLLSFAVEDTGQGISSENLEHLFEPFTQDKKALSLSKGIGLGLFLCREFVHLLGGEISVLSTLNSGSIFSFEIPTYLKSPENNIENKKNKELIFPLEPIQYRLLIADGIPESRQNLFAILKPLGFNVEIASESEECLEFWHCWQPHIILIDLSLPHLENTQLLKQIVESKTDNKTIAIALISNPSDEEWKNAIALGCQDFISKPFREEVVVEKIVHHLSVLSRDRATISLDTLEPSLGDLTREELAIMPMQWLQQFSDATQKINESQLRKLLEEIPDTENHLRQKIARLLDDFRFDILSQLID
ncbi:response regulator [Spirulina sp. 06S082]|uniref:response regulator n=1 Tax=Spirulina sp. 06S082 TaxID=3110248 RepID=UPI002B20DBEE|nr:response regulator [Spirulina sp. 06S082]MEA5470622.1 response regulator [Spirulina sp. 06S082]